MSSLDADYLRRRLRHGRFFETAVRNARAEWPTYGFGQLRAVNPVRDHDKDVLARIAWTQAEHDLAGIDFDDEAA